jgi:O-antigen/teichoic acid export membrane protein
MAGRMGGVAANFFFNLLLARLLAPEDVGTIMLVISTTMLASILTTLNIESGSVRHLVHARESGDIDKAAGFVLFSRRLWLFATPVVILGYLASAYYLNSGGVDDYFWVYLIGSFGITLMGWLRINVRHANVLSRQLAGSIPALLVRPLLLLGFLGLGVLAGVTLTPKWVITFYVLAALIAIIVQFILLYPSFNFIRSGPRDFSARGQWLKTGLLLTSSLIILEYFQDMVLALAAFSLPSAEIAKLAIVLRLIGFLSFGLGAVNMAISPKLAIAIARQDIATREKLLTISTHLKLWPGLIIAAALVIFGELILSIFGPAYIAAAPALNWLVLIPLLMAVLGPNELILNISGLQKYIFLSAIVSILFAIIFIPIGGQYYGLVGATIAAVASFWVWEFSIYACVRKYLGIDASLFASINRSIRGVSGQSADSSS